MEVKRKSIDLPEDVAKYLNKIAVEYDLSYKSLLELIIINEHNFLKSNNMPLIHKTAINKLKKIKI